MSSSSCEPLSERSDVWLNPKTQLGIWTEVRFYCLSAQAVNVDRQEVIPDHEADVIQEEN